MNGRVATEEGDSQRARDKGRLEDIIEYSNNVTNLIEGYSLETLVADLDTLCSWLGMYEEARYVASLDSDEPELKEFSAQYNESIRRGFGLKETKERNI